MPPSGRATEPPNAPPRRAARLTGRTATVALLAAALVLAALAAERLWLIPVRVSFNANEGWNAFQAARAFGAGALYPQPGGLTGDNYPPLSFLFVGGVARLAGADPIIVGRLMSALSLAAVAATVAWTVRRLEPAPSFAPAVAALVFLGFNVTQFRAYVAMDDPQWLAHALMTPALPLLLPARPDASPRPGRTAAAAVLVVLGGLVKHNLLALPLALTAWLLLRHRRAFLVWAVTGAGLAAAAVAAITAAYGSDAVRDILLAERHSAWARMLRASAGPLLAELPLLAASAGLLRLRRTDPRLEAVLLFVAVAVPLGVLQRAGQGVNFNAHFEALIALSIAVGVALAHALAAPRSRAASLVLAAAAAPFVVLAPLAAQAQARELRDLRTERVAWAEIGRRISGAGGPVACETPALCFWAGQPFVLDFFLYGQHAARTGDTAALRRTLDAGGVAAVQRDPGRLLKSGDVADPVLPLLDARSVTTFRAADGRWLETLRR